MRKITLFICMLFGFGGQAFAFGLGGLTGVVDAVTEAVNVSKAAKSTEAIADAADTHGILRHARKIAFAQEAEYLSDQEMAAVVARVNEHLRSMYEEIAEIRANGELPEIVLAGDEKAADAEFTVTLYRRANKGFVDAISRIGGQKHYGFRVENAEGRVVADQGFEVDGDKDLDVIAGVFGNFILKEMPDGLPG